MLKYLSLFFFGAVLGFLFELIFKRLFSKRKWVNPGMLNGPYLPLYGFGIVLLYIISNIEIMAWYKDILLIAIMSSLMILIELITGLIFLKMRIRLWDYSNQFLNYKGVICLLFSLFWLVISIAYYYVFNPIIVNNLAIISNIWFTFILGCITMIFLFDIIYTYDIMNGIRKFAKEKGFVFLYDNLKFSKGKRKVFLKRGRVREVLEEYYNNFSK